jgi:hypothetical protein
MSGQSLAQALLSRMQLSTLPKSGSWLNRALQEPNEKFQQIVAFSNADSGLSWHPVVCYVAWPLCCAALLAGGRESERAALSAADASMPPAASSSAPTAEAMSQILRRV